MAPRKISAKDLVNDVQSGLDHHALIEKYGISEENLTKLLNQLVAKGLLSQGELTSGTPEPPRIDASNGSSRPTTPQPPMPEKTPDQSKSEDITLHSIFGDWYESKRGLILLLIFATPIGLYGLHKTSLWTKKTKIAIAIIAGVLSLTALKPALKIWVSGVIGFGAYGLYNVLPFGKKARVITATLAGMLVLGTIVPYIDKDSGKTRVRTQTTEAAPPVVEPVSPRAVPVAQPVPPQPVQVVQQSKPKPEPKPEPKKEPSSGGKSVSDISWFHVRSKFIEVDTNLTSAQREKLVKDRRQWWQSYKGKWVRWNGSVNNVSSGGTTVKIDMGEGSWGSDVVLAVSPASREKAVGLSKDTYITFVGRMNDQPGGLTAMELQEVTIE